MKEHFNEADHAAGKEAGGRKEEGGRHAADGNQRFHLTDGEKKQRN